MAFDALTDHHLLITFRDAVLNHPTDGAAGRRSCGWIFAAVKKHSGSSFKLAPTPFRTQKIEKICAGFLQEFGGLHETELKIRERLSISERHDGKRQSRRDRLDRTFFPSLASVAASRGKMKVVSERFISRANPCISPAFIARASGKIASGLPASSFCVKTSS